MTPIRKDEKEYNLNRARNLFRDKAQSVRTEIQQQAQDLSDKKKPSFQKLVKVDKKMTALIDAEKKYKKHMQNKDATEKKLFYDMQKKAKEVSEHLKRVSNVRSWDKSFNNFNVSDIDSPASDEFIEDFDVGTIENFEDMYQGQYDSGADFAEQIATDCGYITRDLPSWIEIDWQKTWDNALSYDYTELIGGHIFNNNY